MKTRILVVCLMASISLLEGANSFAQSPPSATAVSCADNGISFVLCNKLKENIPSLANLSDHSLAVIVNDAYERAIQHGLYGHNDQLFFLMTMLNVNPKFDSYGSIALAFTEVKADRIPADQRRVDYITKNSQSQDWDDAGRDGAGFGITYYRALLGNEDMTPFFEARKAKGL